MHECELSSISSYYMLCYIMLSMREMYLRFFATYCAHITHVCSAHIMHRCTLLCVEAPKPKLKAMHLHVSCTHAGKKRHHRVFSLLAKTSIPIHHDVRMFRNEHVCCGTGTTSINSCRPPSARQHQHTPSSRAPPSHSPNLPRNR